MEKICKECNLEKNIELFIKNRNLCKECMKVYKKTYHSKNKETISTLKKEYYISNKEDILNKRKDNYSNNKEQKLDYQRSMCH